MSEKIGLRMAKPNAGDIQMAKDLARAFSEIAEGYMPALIDDDSDERLDTDPRKTREAFYRLCEIAQRGSLDRVVWTLDMLLNPENAVVDPDADHVALHPRFQLMLDALLEVVKWDNETRDLNNPAKYEAVFTKVKAAIEAAKGAPNDQQD